MLLCLFFENKIKNTLLLRVSVIIFIVFGNFGNLEDFTLRLLPGPTIHTNKNTPIFSLLRQLRQLPIEEDEITSPTRFWIACFWKKTKKIKGETVSHKIVLNLLERNRQKCFMLVFSRNYHTKTRCNGAVFAQRWKKNR